MSDASDDRLNVARMDAGLSLDELWLRYFELGGMSTSVELGGNRPVPYSRR